MDPKRVLTFRAVANHRSFTRAAEELALSQPSVSHQVAALEREIGVRLLDRRPGGSAADPGRRARCSSTPTRSPCASTSPRSSSPRSPTTSARSCASAPSRPRSPASCPPPSRGSGRPPGRQGHRRGGRRGRPARTGALRRAPPRHRLPGRRAPRDDSTGTERHDLMREPFLVALPARPSARQRRSRCASTTSPTTTGPPPTPTG